jgi:16S rRNA (adenine1518-N6/adenine1519-N6)-dimethyltransferase
LENKELVTEVVCMLQKEVAERIASAPGKKTYGILSVFLQAFYEIKYLFTVEPHVFTPPPKVKSGVISLKRNNVEKLDCDEKKFKEIVKLAFNQRRKTLRNALKAVIISPEFNKLEILDKRAEQLSVAQFVMLTQMIVAQEKP